MDNSNRLFYQSASGEHIGSPLHNVRIINIFFVYYLFVLLLFSPSAAESHALHPESIDRYAELTITPSYLVVIYQVILGIKPTERATQRLDADNDGKITDEERKAYLDAISQEYTKGQAAHLADKELPLQYQMGDVYSTIGHNGINVLKLDLAYRCPLPADIPRETTLPFSYEDNNFKIAPGWKQMQVYTREGVRFSGHVPYTQYQPFDWEILNNTGFFPSTESIEIAVSLPSTHSSQEFAITLPEKTPYKDLVIKMSVKEKIIIVGVIIFVIVFVTALIFRMRG